MKRPLLVAAVLAAAPLFAGAANATPLQMFNITSSAPGTMTFSGTGTASFNQSNGTNNSINLGSSTSVGVNAAASSTQDYESYGYAQLDLQDSSRIQHTIGTATTAFANSVTTESSATAADVTATEHANSSKYGTEWTRDYNATYSAEVDASYEAGSTWEYDSTRDAGQAYRRLKVGGDASVSADYEYKSEADYEASSKASWKRGWEREYSSQYSQTFSAAQAASSADAGTTSGSGVIIAEFSTTDTGSSSTASAAASGALDASFAAAATSSANNEVGAKTAANTADWEVAYAAAYSAAYAAAESNGARTSNSTVRVEGLGNIADINSRETSNFIAESDLTDGVTRPDSLGNGNASAGSSVATSSFATQSNAVTASGFMQAFTGGGLKQDSVIVGIEDVTQSGDTVNTYDVSTAASQVTTTQITTDLDGVVQ